MKGIGSPPRQVYVEDWFACTIGGTYQIDHYLDSTILDVTVQFAPDDGGAPDLSQIVHQDGYWYGGSGATSGSCAAKCITANSLIVQAGNTNCGVSLTAAGAIETWTSGWYRVIVERIA